MTEQEIEALLPEAYEMPPEAKAYWQALDVNTPIVMTKGAVAVLLLAIDRLTEAAIAQTQMSALLVNGGQEEAQNQFVLIAQKTVESQNMTRRMIAAIAARHAIDAGAVQGAGSE